VELREVVSLSDGYGWRKLPRKSRKSDREAKAFKNTFLFRSLELVQQHVSFAYLNSVWFCFIAGKKKKVYVIQISLHSKIPVLFRLSCPPLLTTANQKIDNLTNFRSFIVTVNQNKSFFVKIPFRQSLSWRRPLTKKPEDPGNEIDSPYPPPQKSFFWHEIFQKKHCVHFQNSSFCVVNYG